MHGCSIPEGSFLPKAALLVETCGRLFRDEQKAGQTARSLNDVQKCAEGSKSDKMLQKRLVAQRGVRLLACSGPDNSRAVLVGVRGRVHPHVVHTDTHRSIG